MYQQNKHAGDNESMLSLKEKKKSNERLLDIKKYEILTCSTVCRLGYKTPVSTSAEQFWYLTVLSQRQATVVSFLSAVKIAAGCPVKK